MSKAGTLKRVTARRIVLGAQSLDLDTLLVLISLYAWVAELDRDFTDPNTQAWLKTAIDPVFGFQIGRAHV